MIEQTKTNTESNPTNPTSTKPNNPNPKPQSKPPPKYHTPNFHPTPKLLQQILFKNTLSTELIEDFRTYYSDRKNQRKVVDMLREFLKEEGNLRDVAEYADQIVGDLTYKAKHPKIPTHFITCLLHILISQKPKITPYLTPSKPQIQTLLLNAPFQHILPIIDLYSLKLSKKTATTIFDDLAHSSYITLIPEFLAKVDYDFGDRIVELAKLKGYKALRKMPGLKRLLEHPELRRMRENMLFDTARYMLRAEGIEYLQEIFGDYPDTIIKVLNTSFNKVKNINEFIDFCNRNPKIFTKLKPQLKSKVPNPHPQHHLHPHAPANSLTSNKFAPSNKQLYLSFQEFNLKQQDIIWVDQTIEAGKLAKIREHLLSCDEIGIDTESVVARTPVDEDIDVLALVQVATGNCVYLFDAFRRKSQGIVGLFKEMFKNPNLSIIGHTVKNDVDAVAKLFGVPEVKCKIVDVKEMHVNKSAGLKTISKAILGKEICKKHCLTNWGRRPLNLCQIHYAALDAFVVLKIHQELKLVQHQQKKPQKKDKKKSRKQSQTSPKNPQQQPPIQPPIPQ